MFDNVKLFVNAKTKCQHIDLSLITYTNVSHTYYCIYCIIISKFKIGEMTYYNPNSGNVGTFF